MKQKLFLQKVRVKMASENKKRKAKNSYLHNGNEAQKIHKLKRIAYFIKADRKWKAESEE